MNEKTVKIIITIVTTFSIILFSVLFIISIISFVFSFSDYEEAKVSGEKSFYFDKIRSDNIFRPESLGKSLYLCSGTCFCDEDGKRRTSHTISKGMKYFVTAISSLVAINIAKTSFHEQCVEYFTSEDSSCTNVRSEVDDCDSESCANYKDECQPNQYGSVDNSFDPEDIGNRMFDNYICKGRCYESDVYEVLEKAKPKNSGIPRELVRLFEENIPIIEEGVKEFGCENLEHEEEIEAWEMAARTTQEVGESELDYAMRVAKTKFVNMELAVFCFERSRKEYGLKNSRGGPDRPQTIPLCQSRPHNNPSIECKRLLEYKP